MVVLPYMVLTTVTEAAKALLGVTILSCSQYKQLYCKLHLKTDLSEGCNVPTQKFIHCESAQALR